jgi:selenocysteine lyase/cysteine desulfurase
MMTPDFDLTRVPSDFPALDEGCAYSDGPDGSQVPRQVADAIASTMVSGISNRGTLTPHSAANGAPPDIRICRKPGA